VAATVEIDHADPAHPTTAEASTSTRTPESKRISTPISDAGGIGDGIPNSPATASTPAMNESN